MTIFKGHWVFGVGYTRDETLLALLPINASSFWFSDYGILTYLVRFGLIGWVLTMLIVFIFGVSLRSKALFAWFIILVLYSIPTPVTEYFGIGFALFLGLIPAIERESYYNFLSARRYA